MEEQNLTIPFVQEGNAISQRDCVNLWRVIQWVLLHDLKSENYLY